jgi:peptidyl-prolyl cis-trans isomerase D
MLESFRKHQRTLLMMITIVVIVAFAWFYNPTNFQHFGRGRVGKLNGRTISIEEIQKTERVALLSGDLGLIDLASQLVTDGQTREEQGLSFAWNLLLLRDEAKRLQIEPTAEEIADAERKLERFQTDGKFDPKKFQTFVDTVLKPHGLTAADVDQTVADSLRLEGIAKLIRPSNQLPEPMFRREYEFYHQAMHLALIRFPPAEFANQVQISDEELRKYYDEQKDHLQSPEKRKIQLVSFLLNEEQKKLTGEEKIKALRPLAEQAEAFVQPLYERPDAFAQQASEKQLKVQETGLFTVNQPDPAIAHEPAITRQVFNLTKENPVSDVIEGGDGYYVVRLVEVEPPKPLSFDEAKEQTTTAIKDEKTRAAMQAKANEVLQKIAEARKEGVPFEQAAEKAGYKPELPPAFSLSEPGDNLELIRILRFNQIDLAPGDTSQLIQDQSGGLLVHMLKKDPVDEAKYEQAKKELYPAQNREFANLAVREWLKAQQQKSGRPAMFAAEMSG